jgi:hypothetical protein
MYSFTFPGSGVLASLQAYANGDLVRSLLLHFSVHFVPFFISSKRSDNRKLKN